MKNTKRKWQDRGNNYYVLNKLDEEGKFKDCRASIGFKPVTGEPFIKTGNKRLERGELQALLELVKVRKGIK